MTETEKERKIQTERRKNRNGGGGEGGWEEGQNDRRGESRVRSQSRDMVKRNAAGHQVLCTRLCNNTYELQNENGVRVGLQGGV